jgi:hypothetical protein
MKTLPAIVALSFGIAATSIAASARADVLTYVGSTSDWFNPRNWDLGRLPGPSDDVIIDDGRSVVINPAVGPAQVTIRDITISDDASLETLAGTEITTRNETLVEGGQLILRSTRAFDDAVGGTLAALPRTASEGPGSDGPVLNPSTQSKRDVILKSSVSFGLGGTLPASIVTGGAGSGHYATITTENADLGGVLNIALYYGFTPSSGQTFKIIDITTSNTGEFDGLAEGALVQVFGNIGLYISYIGGDGNDVVLSAVELRSTAAFRQDPFNLWTTEAETEFLFAR